MKHGFVQEMEDVLDGDKNITHEALSTKIEAIKQQTALRATALKVGG